MFQTVFFRNFRISDYHAHVKHRQDNFFQTLTKKNWWVKNFQFS